MAVPKRRTSRSRTRHRRAQWAGALSATMPTVTRCPCPRRELTVAHHACAACGRYRDAQVLPR